MISVDFAPNQTAADVPAFFRAFFSSWKRGPALTRVRSRLAERFEVNQAQVFLFLSGRSAIYTALKSLRMYEGDQVIVPSFTCEAVVLPILKLGGTPIYADIEPKTYTLTLDEVKSKVTSKTKVILLQHTFGLLPEDREGILTFARTKKIHVIEDMAHGFAPKVTTDHPETIKILSFGRSKAFSSVFGGALIVPEEFKDKVGEYYSRLTYPTLGFIAQTLLYVPVSLCIKLTYHIGIGRLIHAVVRASRLLIPEISQIEKSGKYDGWLDNLYPNALAILLESQLIRFEETTKRRQAVIQIYQEELGIHGRPVSRFPVLVIDRSHVKSLFRDQGIFLGTWYVQPVAPQELDLTHMQYVRGSCKEAERICDHVVNLPLHVSLSQAHMICRMIKPHLL